MISQGKDGQAGQGAARPLVSFCIKFFNHRKFCREALLAAFRQTYSPLEIIVTDDGSTDGTADVVTELIDEYVSSGGKHVVVKLFNETNIGITKTSQRQFKAAKGELLIQADGDDISFPDRVAKIVAAWEMDGRKVGYIIHDAIDINSSATRILGIRRNADPLIPLGAASAYSHRVVSDFSDIDVRYKTTSEDMIFSKRGMLVGGYLHVAEPLVYYRIGSGLTSHRGFVENRMYATTAALDGVRQVRRDLDQSRKWQSVLDSNYLKLRRDARRYAVRYYAESQLYSARSFRRRWIAWKIYARQRRMPLLSVNSLECALMGLPPFQWLRLLIGRILSTYWDVKRYVHLCAFTNGSICSQDVMRKEWAQKMQKGTSGFIFQ